MNLRGLALILIGIVAIILVLVFLGETQGSDWSEASGAVASVSILILFISIAAAVIFGRD